MARVMTSKLDVLVVGREAYTLFGPGKLFIASIPQVIDNMKRSRLTRVVATREATELIRSLAEQRTPDCRLAIGGPRASELLAGGLPTAFRVQRVMDYVDGLRASQGGWHVFAPGVDGPHLNVLTCPTAAKLHPVAGMRQFLVQQDICDEQGFNALLDIIRDPRWFVTGTSCLKFTKLHSFLDLRPSMVRRWQEAPEARDNRVRLLLRAFTEDIPVAGPADWFSVLRSPGGNARLINSRLKKFVTFLALTWLGEVLGHPELVVPDHFFAEMTEKDYLLERWKSTVTGCVRRF